jgi:hypothetical protein
MDIPMDMADAFKMMDPLSKEPGFLLIIKKTEIIIL